MNEQLLKKILIGQTRQSAQNMAIIKLLTDIHTKEMGKSEKEAYQETLADYFNRQQKTLETLANEA